MSKIVDEHTILEADTGGFTLTSHKVRFHAEQGGHAKVTSIMLEHVTSCDIDKKSNPILLGIALFFLVGGIMVSVSSGPGGGFILGLIVAIIFVLMYIFTRRQVLTISSPSSKIDLNTQHMPIKKVIETINHIEAAKNKRYQSI